MFDFQKFPVYQKSKLNYKNLSNLKSPYFKEIYNNVNKEQRILTAGGFEPTILGVKVRDTKPLYDAAV